MNIVNNHDTSTRVDVLLAEANPSYSRAALAKLFNLNCIKQAEKYLKAGDKIKPGDSFIADISPITKPADNITLPIIFEDDNVIVIDKPVGIISHSRGKYWDEPSVASFVRNKVSGISGERAGIVHRLDKATSGVMICAKNPETLSFLQKQFSSRKVKKTYNAVVIGKPKDQEALIDIPLNRNPNNPKSHMVDINGKPSQTYFRLLQSNNKYSLLELTPKTGRTHQIRVHLSHIGNPIVGDELYKGNLADRLYLHATSLEITIPDGQRRTFVSELPKEFNNISS